MKKRMIIMLWALGLLLGGLVGFNLLKGIMIQKYMAAAPVPQRRSRRPRPTTSNGSRSSPRSARCARCAAST